MKFKHTPGLVFIVLILTAISSDFAWCQLAADTKQPKKLLEWGWDEPDTRFMREHIGEMEEAPFDGLVFHVNSSKGANFTWEMWGERQFTVHEFQPAIDDLKATPFKRFTDRFLRVNVTPGKVDWFDDQAWRVVANNFAVAAQIAKQGGCMGLMFDVEQYEGQLFDYRQQKHHAQKSFADYQQQVKRRGREWIQEVNQHFPEITILSTFGYSVTRPQNEAADRSESPSALLADFLDGVLEACSKQTAIVDAWENSYPYKQRAQFEEARDTIKNKNKNPLWTAVPEKYGSHVSAGFGIWMDYNWRKNGWDVADFSKNHFSPEQLEAAIRSALQVSDRYVWIYSEQPRWWTKEKLPPAYVEAVRKSRQPLAD